MASLRKHPGSRFWYVRFRDPDTAQWREESTKLLIDDEKQTRAAQRIRDKHTQDESLLATSGTGNWIDWVPAFIASHYASDSTRRRSTFAWERLQEWIRLRNLQHPRQIRYEHAENYMAWRKLAGTSHNTALYEIKFLAFLINEAIRREFAERNVIARAGIAREQPHEKPELTDDQIAKAWPALKEPWMVIVFATQLYTGCRFSEANIPKERIDFAANSIIIEDAKRKKSDPRKLYTVPLDPHLAAILQKAEPVPTLTRAMNARFNEALKAATGATSHSLRVTFISRCEEAGLSEREAMRLVNHSSKNVHAIYARRRMDYLRAPRLRVSLPPPPSVPEGKP